jgi:hypothetical protein
VQGAKHEGCSIIEVAGIESVGVDWDGGLEDWDVDGDHFRCVVDGGLRLEAAGMCQCSYQRRL